MNQEDDYGRIDHVIPWESTKKEIQIHKPEVKVPEESLITKAFKSLGLE